MDTARGKPAAGVDVALFRLENGERKKLCERKTNEDGRMDGALMEGAEFRPGEYELDFSVGEYFGNSNNAGGDADTFLGVVTVRFRINDANANYHIPLLVSPYGYTTYRGS